VIIESRRAIAWSYPYGYYLNDQAKKNMYQQIQWDLENTLEKIAKYIEISGFDKLIEKDNTTGHSILAEKYFTFQDTVIKLTITLKQYLKNVM
jgi:hypothetical protein